MNLALFEPDIPQNTGTIMRLCACLGVALDIIEPCGFLLTDKNLKRAGMDYLDHLNMTRHANWEAFKATALKKRIVLLTTKTAMPYADFKFSQDDILLLGRESTGVPDHIHSAVTARITIPMTANMRSLNVAVAAAMVLGEALRQTGSFPQAHGQNQ